MKAPTVDMEECVDCDACVELCPTVFKRNDMGIIEVMDLSEYPKDEVDDVIANCPCDCIHWEDF